MSTSPDQAAHPAPYRIDTHHHIVPPAYAAFLRARGLDAGGLPIPAWDRDTALQTMDRLGVRAAVLSVSTPGVHHGDDAEARRLARQLNQQVAGVVADDPGRFGWLATLTLPDVPGAIAEATHALDVLKADGVVLLGSVRGQYLGAPELEPLMAALDERAAVVFIHPSELSIPALPGLPAFVADFLLDTTRAAIGISRAGWHQRYPKLRFILSHGGGFVPYAAERVARFCSPGGEQAEGLANLRRFWFDTALTSARHGLPSLLSFADPGRVLFGSDWPYANADRAAHFTRQLDEADLPTDLRDAINFGNAASLFPRLATAPIRPGAVDVG